MHDISIVTATFNRKQLVCRSINASLVMLNQGTAKEIVVVDDGSTDGTFEEIHRIYPLEIANGSIKIERLEMNVGVTGAKNRGARLATGRWVAFMDSDDVFLPDAGALIQKSLSKLSNYDLVFFRCLDISNQTLIGGEIGKYELSFSQLFNDGTPGECMPIVKTSAITRYPYIAQLRGCESLAYLSMLSENCKAYVSDEVVRGYDASSLDRLSNKIIIKTRAVQLLKYNLLILKYFRKAKIKTLVKIFARIGYYLLLSLQLKVKQFNE